MKIADQFALELALEQLLELTRSLDVAMTGSLSISGNLVHFDNNVKDQTAKFNNVRALVARHGDLAGLIKQIKQENIERKILDTIKSTNKSFETYPTPSKTIH